MRLLILLIMVILGGCAGKPVVKADLGNPCAGVREAMEEADLRVYLAEWESEGLRGELRALREKVASFLRHPHTCRHKDLLK